MKDKIRELSNDELLQVYNMVLSHLEYLDSEEKKIEDDSK